MKVCGGLWWATAVMGVVRSLVNFSMLELGCGAAVCGPTAGVEVLGPRLRWAGPPEGTWCPLKSLAEDPSYRPPLHCVGSDTRAQSSFHARNAELHGSSQTARDAALGGQPT